MEYHTIHTATKVLVEYLNLSLILRIPHLVLVVILNHIYVLGIIRRNPYLVLWRLLFGVRLASRHILKFLGNGVVLVDGCYELLLGKRTIIQHAMLVVFKVGHHINKLLWVYRYKLGAVGYVAHRIIGSILAICLQSTEVRLLAKLVVAA